MELHKSRKTVEFETFNDGYLTVYATRKNAAKAKTGHLRYGNSTYSEQKYLEARQNGMKIARVVRVPYTPQIAQGDMVEFDTGDQLDIQMIQHKQDTMPPISILTLGQNERNVHYYGED